ncbi:MAG: DJ-1/PfpI family protein [Jatrophihabitans sp.]|uniref:DJ-1/PfpI family protein n=1 Tax=Jatrophihabitans sp. TaxID=1932789 RepID=UPI003911EE5F
MIPSPVHVAVFDTMADWELGYATAHITRPSWQWDPGRFKIVTAGLTPDPITTMGGLRILPDVVLDAVRPQDSAMLILAGGDTWAEDAMAPFRATARRFLEADVPVAAICGATFGLALEGLLDDRRHTSNAAEYLAMSGYAGGRLFDDEPVVIDGALVTGSGVAPVHFAKAIFDVLGIYEPSVAESWFKLYGNRDPAGFFELMAV